MIIESLMFMLLYITEIIFANHNNETVPIYDL
jgi:hypothetical protein